MGISDRIKLLLRSEFNSWKGSSKDSKNLLIALENEFKTLLKEEQHLIQSIRNLRDQIEVCDENAKLALSKHVEERARHLLGQKSQLQREQEKLREELRQTQKYLSDIGQKMQQLESLEDNESSPSQTVPTPIPGAESDLNQPQGGWHRVEKMFRHNRHDIFDPASSPSHMSNSHHGDIPFRNEHDIKATHGEFQRMADRIHAFEADVDAEHYLNHENLSGFRPTPDPLLDPEGVRFEQEFRKLEENEEKRRISDDLEDLKSQFNS